MVHSIKQNRTRATFAFLIVCLSQIIVEDGKLLHRFIPWSARKIMYPIVSIRLLCDDVGSFAEGHVIFLVQAKEKRSRSW